MTTVALSDGTYAEKVVIADAAGLNVSLTVDGLEAVIGSKAAGTAATSSELIGGVYNTTAPAPTNGQQTALQVDASGRLLTAATGAGGKSASAAFTPAAASHVANDCNGAAGTFALVAPSACAFLITDATLLINSATAEATAWRLYLYNVTPPSAYADDAAWDIASGDQASFLGYIDLGTAVDLGSSQWVENRGINKAVKLAGTSLFGYLVNLTTLTPAAVAHTVTLVGTPL